MSASESLCGEDNICESKMLGKLSRIENDQRKQQLESLGLNPPQSNPRIYKVVLKTGRTVFVDISTESRGNFSYLHQSSQVAGGLKYVVD
jgi:hypothetical protein